MADSKQPRGSQVIQPARDAPSAELQEPTGPSGPQETAQVSQAVQPDEVLQASQPVAVPPQPEPGKRVPFYKHPAFGITTGIASLISIPLSIYLALANVRKPELSYAFHPNRTKIVAADGDSRLKVTYDGQDVKGNVTAVQFALWNAGAMPIQAADILKRLTLTASTTVRILDATIAHLTRDVTGFRLDDTQKAAGTLAFDWRILEHNDGAAIQIVFEGPPDASFALAGTIVGQRTLSEHKSDASAGSKAEKPFRLGQVPGWRLFVVLAIALIVGSVGIFLIAWGIVELMRKRTQNVFLAVGSGIYCLGFAVWGVLWFVERANMPFTF
jgi:hypothetical protein